MFMNLEFDTRVSNLYVYTTILQSEEFDIYYT